MTSIVTVKELKGIIKSLKDENQKLQQEIGVFKKESSALVERLLSLQQRSRLKNIEITGVPETTGDACMDIVVDGGTSRWLIESAPSQAKHLAQSCASWVAD